MARSFDWFVDIKSAGYTAQPSRGVVGIQHVTASYEVGVDGESLFTGPEIEHSIYLNYIICFGWNSITRFSLVQPVAVEIASHEQR